MSASTGCFGSFATTATPIIDVKREQEGLTELVEVEDGDPFILHPGEFVLGSTLERVKLPDDLVARLEGKSSLGRLGLLIHSTAGFIDPGWDGHVTLELSNVASLPITIYPEMKIGQLSFVQMTEPTDHPYGSSGARLEVPGPAWPDPEPVLAQLRARGARPGNRKGARSAPFRIHARQGVRKHRPTFLVGACWDDHPPDRKPHQKGEGRPVGGPRSR